MRFINLKTKREEASLPFPSVLCIGNFDGVHLGHRQLVASVIDEYKKLNSAHPNLVSGAWFFDSISYKSSNEIYSIHEKLEVFSDLGLDYAIIASFEDLKSLSPEDFVNDVLKVQSNCIHAICGENFRFGKFAAGDSKKLYELMGGCATIVNLLSVDEHIISSTYIRSLLENGDIQMANLLLGNNYSISEVVIHGKALGRKLGMPTINQNITSKNLILRAGIYSTICHIDGKKYYGVTNVGTRPTVDNAASKNVETYIIDFDGDCYDKMVRVEFINRVRDERKFDSLDALKEQVQRDILSTRQFFHI